MKILLKVNDTKADSTIQLLNNLKGVKYEIITPAKAQFLKQLKSSIQEVAAAKQGKTKLQSAKDFLNA